MELFKLEDNYVNLKCVFCGCLSLSSLADISKWNIDNQEHENTNFDSQGNNKSFEFYGFYGTDVEYFVNISEISGYMYQDKDDEDTLLTYLKL